MRTLGRARAVRLIAAALATAALLGGCAPAGSRTSITGDWRLVSGRDSSGAYSLGGAHVTLKIHGDKSGGQGPCNYYGSPIEGSTTGSIQVNIGAVTSMGCVPKARMTLETRYLNDLNGQMGATLKNGRLTLTSGQVRLTFTRDTK